MRFFEDPILVSNGIYWLGLFAGLVLISVLGVLTVVCCRRGMIPHSMLQRFLYRVLTVSLFPVFLAAVAGWCFTFCYSEKIPADSIGVCPDRTLESGRYLFAAQKSTLVLPCSGEFKLGGKHRKDGDKMSEEETTQIVVMYRVVEPQNAIELHSLLKAHKTLAGLYEWRLEKLLNLPADAAAPLDAELKKLGEELKASGAEVKVVMNRTKVTTTTAKSQSEFQNM